MKKNKIKPMLLGGFKDYLPNIMIYRQEVIENIKKTFESFGFSPMDTPCLERSSVLGTDEDEFKMEVYRFNDSFKGNGQDVTLRFDLTVPLSRVIATYPKLLKPFKRYQYGNVWRKEKQQDGRYREFFQFDADIVGSSSIIADFEIIMLIYETLKNLSINNFLIKFNNRKILNGLSSVVGFSENQTKNVLRILDKLDKIGLKKVLEELQKKPIELSVQNVNKIQEFLNISNYSNQLLPELKKYFKGVKIAEEGIIECEKIIEKFQILNIPKENWKFDISIARGLGYYTGIVFETILTDIPEIGSIFSGGRYDELVMRYTGEKIPSVGASVGVDRLISALEKINKIQKKQSVSKILFTVIDDNLINEILKITQNFRKSGINTEIYFGKNKTLKAQIIYAIKREIPFIAILGEDEKREKKIRLKDLNKKKEILLTEKEIIDKLKLIY